MKHILISALLFSALLAPSCNVQENDTIDLSGEWQTELGAVNLPGTTDLAAVGTKNTNLSVTTGLSRKYVYEGALSYSRTIDIPANWAGRHIELFLERTKPTTLIIDGDTIGRCYNMQTPHIYDISNIKTGLHNLEIIVNNGDAILDDIKGSHAYGESTQTNWNGIIGRMEITSKPNTYITDCQLFTNIDSEEVTARVTISKAGKIKLSGNIDGTNISNSICSTVESGDTLELTLKIPNAKLWSEFHPELYTFNIALQCTEGIHYHRVQFGMRHFTTEGRQFVINNKKTFLRGTHDACVFPRTAVPPTDIDSWRSLFRKAKSIGINHFRFHSYTPPEAAFCAADELGVYLQPELPFWGEISRSKSALNELMVDDAKEILRTYGNHPSFVMMACGNELCGDIGLLREWCEAFRKIDNRHIYAYGSNNNLGWSGQAEGEDFFVTCRVGAEEKDGFNTHVRSSFSFADANDGGILNALYPTLSRNYSEAISNCTVPVVSHESGQFQIYPTYDEHAYDDCVLAPNNLKIFHQRLVNAKLGELELPFHYASGCLAYECYKADIEMCLRTPEFGGFQMLDIKDYPGQGSALVGFYDALMLPKKFFEHYYDQKLPFCAPVVPLAQTDKMTYDQNEPINVDILISNYTEDDIIDEPLIWNVTDEHGYNVANGSIAASMKQGSVGTVGHISIPTNNVEAPSKLTLSMKLNKYAASNYYHFWVYENEKFEMPRTFSHLNAEVETLLDSGACVIFTPSHNDIEDISVGGMFTPDYWNYAMFKTISENNNRPISPGTLGLLPSSSARGFFKNFPTDNHSDWQWWIIAKNSRPMILDSALQISPIVWAIDNIERNHKLGILFKIDVGLGHLIVCTTDFKAISATPEGRQYIRAIERYAKSKNIQASSSPMTWKDVVDLFHTQANEREIKGVHNISDYKQKN
ncbi:MAG: glycoside hydrolase [Bacteroidales bacterium]|jgi:hypothetical protein|nr:glycoside hydrolase [Bacteroidales bacterium]